MEQDHDEKFQQQWQKYLDLAEKHQRLLRQREPCTIYGVKAGETKPPADFSAHGREGAKVKRAAVVQRMTAREREVYRAGYQAGHRLRQRWLAAVQRVLQSL